jgi:hypothetical protein
VILKGLFASFRRGHRGAAGKVVGMEVFVVADSLPVRGDVPAWLNGTLPAGDNILGRTRSPNSSHIAVNCG